MFAWEQRWFFDHGWVCVGRTADMPAPGDQRAVTVGDAGVLLVRDRVRGLGVFANACRHRGHELLPCRCDTTNRGTILCPYHGWAYDLDGALLSTPHFEAPDGFDPRSTASHRSRVEESHGWAMVDVTGSAPPLHRFLDGLEERITPYEPERLTVGDTHSYSLETNWKLIVENYHECFHCPSVHPSFA